MAATLLLGSCGPTEVLVGDAPGVARVVLGVLGVPYAVSSFLDTAVVGDALKIPIGTSAGVAAAEDGSFYSSDPIHRRVAFVSSDGQVSWPIGRGICGFPGTGGPEAANLCLSLPTALALEADGGLLIADPGANIVYRYLPESGEVERVLGSGRVGLAADGSTAASSETNRPEDVAVGPDGSVFVAESGNNRVIRIDGGVIRVIAGTGAVGDSGDGGAAAEARLRRPEGLAWMGDTLYIADTGNNRIRRVIDGIIHAYAGLGAPGFAGDGTAAALALFARPGRMAAFGTLLFIADRDNNRVRVIRVGPDSIATFGGTGRYAVGENLLEIGRTALATPAGVAVAGRAVFIADSGAFVVRRVIR
ncbi:MAG TPA: hypothetical protein VGA37_02795 [Gemmatimonadales bacterium]